MAPSRLPFDRRGEAAVREGEAAGRGDGLREVVVPVDGSDTGSRALPFAFALAGRLRLEVTTVHVGSDRSVRADHHLDGDPADAIARFVGAEPGRVLCLSTHGRGGVRRALLGSVTEELLRTSAVPVFVVGPHVAMEPPVVLPRTVVAVKTGGDDEALAGVRGWADELDAELQEVVVTPDDPVAGLHDDAHGWRTPALLVVADGPEEDAVTRELLRHGPWTVLTRPSGRGAATPGDAGAT
jgi:nucleotide-binding universal stress UspA family protein